MRELGYGSSYDIAYGEQLKHEMTDLMCWLSFDRRFSDRARSVFICANSALQKDPNAGGNPSNQNMVNNATDMIFNDWKPLTNRLNSYTISDYRDSGGCRGGEISLDAAMEMRSICRPIIKTT